MQGPRPTRALLYTLTKLFTKMYLGQGHIYTHYKIFKLNLMVSVVQLNAKYTI